MSQIWAKSRNQTSLKHHVEGLFEQFENLKNAIKNKDLFLDYETLIKYSIFAHDLGKVAPSFQYQMENLDYSPKVGFPVIPHSIFSLVWIDEQELENKLKLELKDSFKKEDVRIVMTAVAFHHWRDNFELIVSGNSSDVKEIGEKLIDNIDLRNKLFNNLKEELKDVEKGKYLSLIKFNEDINYDLSEGNSLTKYVTPPYGNYFLPERIISNNLKLQVKQIYVLGTLMRVDHFASYVQDEGLDNDPKDKMIYKVERDIPDDKTIETNIINSLPDEFKNKLWQKDKVKDVKNDNVILVAPTGLGKTEYAYLWGSGEKLFFTLPLRSAVNSIYERTCKIFNQEANETSGEENLDLGNVCLLHSDADVYLSEKSTNFEGENIRILEMSKHLSYPVIVSTGDQIFPYALKAPGYEKMYSTLAYSKLVIDEVQAYNPESVAVIVKLIEDVTKLGGKFLLMTATLPNFIKDEIKKRVETKYQLKEENLYEGLEKIKKHKIKLRNESIKNGNQEIIDKAINGNRVLIIVNTVSKAQEIYKELSKILDEKSLDIRLDLLHSKFTFNDRRKKENELINIEFKNPKGKEDKKGKILISTQLIEASVDIDADILYTELCPLDSLVQRMGRVLRRQRAEKGGEYVYPNENSNIIIFFNKNEDKKDESKKRFSIESGDGKVYDNEILILSLCLLFEKTGNLPTAKINELIDKYSKDKKKDKEKWLNNIIEESKPKKSSKEIEYNLEAIAETEKKELVEKLYDFVEKNPNSSYMKKFNSNLSILDSGYTSENKREAQRFFRDISTVPAIPDSLLDKFVKKLKKYISEEAKKLEEKEKVRYTYFKEFILSDFIINISSAIIFRKGDFEIKNLSLTLDEIKINIEDITTNEDIILKKIRKWLKNTYIFSGSYSYELGVELSARDSQTDFY